MTNDITILIPIGESDRGNLELLKRAVKSVKACQEFYKDGKLIVTIVAPFPCDDNFDNLYDKWILNNSGDSTYCGQVNYGAQSIDTKYFSILEIDDSYLEKWFKFFAQYLYGNEAVTVFMPINLVTDEEGVHWQYGNEAPLAEFFSSEIGIIDYDCLQDWGSFTLAGSVINREDFINVGMYKPSIKIASDYELLLRMASKKLKIMVVPKEGYKHYVGRKGSLTDINRKEMEGTEDAQKWFDLAKREHKYKEDRKKGISHKNKEELK